MAANEAACTASTFREMVRKLVAACPPPEGLKIAASRVSPKRVGGGPGDCTLDRRTMRIQIANNLTLQETEWTLVEEWAHAMAWQPTHPYARDHDAIWGVWYARVRAAYYGDSGTPE